jgi:hypothetical protein
MYEVFSHRCSELLRPYSKQKTLYIDALMKTWYFGQSLSERDQLLLIGIVSVEAKQRGISSIAIYGMSSVGEWLKWLFTSAKVAVKFGIDRRADCIDSDIAVICPQDDFPDEVDAVIVSVFGDYTFIESLLSKQTATQIISAVDFITDEEV